MAYVSQDDKKAVAPIVKAILSKNGLKGTLSVHNGSTLVLKIAAGYMDFLTDYNEVSAYNAVRRGETPYTTTDNINVNVYHIDSTFSPKFAKVLNELHEAMKGEGYFNNDDSMTDYFHRSRYIDINIGTWNKPYRLVK